MKEKKLNIEIKEKRTGSPAWSLDTTDWKKIGKGALIAFGGAALVSLGEWITTGTVQPWKSALIAAASVGINAVWKYLQGEAEE